MTNPPTICDFGTQPERSQAIVPAARQLEALFNVIPEDDLLSSLKVYYAGRRGYTYRVLWRTYVAMSVLNLPSFAALIRTLQNNPYVALACGIDDPEHVPSKFAFSRFMRKLQTKRREVLVKNMMRNLTRQCYQALPDFGKSVAIDSTDLKAWSNGTKETKSDPDAGWVIKDDSHGKRKFVWGYKMHLMVDTVREIPITASITRGNMSDIVFASHVLQQARFTYGKFHPEYVICDAGYSGSELRRLIKNQYWARPIINRLRATRNG